MKQFGMSLAIFAYERKWRTNMSDNQYQELFDRQKRTFASGVTRTYDWRVDSLDWQVLLFASIAITPRFAAVCTQLGRVEVEGRQRTTDGESADKIAPTMS